MVEMSRKAGVPDQRCVPEWPPPDPMTNAWAMQAAYQVAETPEARGLVLYAGEITWPHPCFVGNSGPTGSRNG